MSSSPAAEARPPRRARWHDSLFARLLLLQAALGVGYALLFGVLFYAERNATVAGLLAERWAPALRQAAGVSGPATAGVDGPVLLQRRGERPPHALLVPAIGPRLTRLQEALRSRGVPLQHLAVVPGDAGAVLWLALQPPGQTAALWVSLPGEAILPQVPVRLLLSLGAGLALMALASWWFTRRLTRPLARLRDHMQAQQPALQAPPAATLGGAVVPELQAIDQAFNALLARYQRHEAERALLLAGVSHDLRSPLARIRMAADLLPDEPPLAARRDSIVRNVAVADRLIASFLDHVRSGELPMDEAVDLAALARQLASEPARQLAGLRVQAPATLVLPRANALLLERLLANLLDNAVQHGRPPLALRVLDRPGEVWIEVADGGPGIAPDRRAALWQAFARGDASRGQAGLGLGLAVVQRVVGRLGGQVSFVDGPLPTPFAVRVVLPR